MVIGEGGHHINLVDPSVVKRGLLDFPTLPLGSPKNQRGDVLWLARIEQRGFPKGSASPVANGDSGRGVEEILVLLIAWVSQANPQPLKILK